MTDYCIAQSEEYLRQKSIPYRNLFVETKIGAQIKVFHAR